MGSERSRSADFEVMPEVSYQAALGVAQHEKKYEIRAAHNDGHVLIIRQKTKALSWPKAILLRAQKNGAGSSISVTVQNMPGAPSALLDGVFNGKVAEKYLKGIQEALTGAISAPATPVRSHYVRDDGVNVPWKDPEMFPEF